jgi:hypothetical protein
MTVPAGFRERLTASIQLQLSHRGLGGSVSDAAAIADRALRDARVEALAEYVTVADAGGDLTEARALLAADPLTEQMLTVEP